MKQPPTFEPDIPVNRRRNVLELIDKHGPLTFDRLRTQNAARTRDVFHPIGEWSPTDWATAMAGECGEACNLIKKQRRGERVPLSDIGDELADLIIYADLLAARLGIDLDNAIRRKFNDVSKRRGSTIKL